jgi:hypothetical protein
MLSIIAILAVILAVILVVLVAKPGQGNRPSSSSGLLHPVVRVLGVVWFIVTIAATAWFTWKDHAPRTEREVSVLTPSRPTPSVPVTDLYESIEVEPCQLVMTLLLFDPKTEQAVWSASQAIRWPEERRFTFEMADFNIKLNAYYEIRDFQTIPRNGGLKPVASGSMDLTVRYGNGSSGIGGSFSGLLDEPEIHDDGLGAGTLVRHPLSVVPQRSHDLLLLRHLTRASIDDTLQPVAATEWLHRFPADQLKHAGTMLNPSRRPSDAPPGALMMRQVGTAGFFLMLAAIAGAQCFRRRGLAFTALLAGMVLYVGTLDYFILRYHAGRAKDESLSPGVRQSAAASARQTFFHQAAAEKLLDPSGS